MTRHLLPPRYRRLTASRAGSADSSGTPPYDYPKRRMAGWVVAGQRPVKVGGRFSAKARWPGRAHQAAHALGDLVYPPPAGIRAVLPKPGDRPVARLTAA